jgi:hypothetical protein
MGAKRLLSELAHDGQHEAQEDAKEAPPYSAKEGQRARRPT